MIPSAFKRLFGLLPQEYLCVAKEDLDAPPKVYLSTEDSNQLVDVTGKQILLGYNPLILAIGFDDSTERICLSFGAPASTPAQWHGFPSAASAIGRIELKTAGPSLDVPGWRLFTGVRGEHNFLRSYQRLANAVRMALRSKPASTANISGNLYDQVRIAYSSPRQISVITVKDNELLNFFPTDLHGRLDSNHYISSLRIGGMACSQVELCKRIVISTVNVSSFRDVYALGKNHMQQPRPQAHFKTSDLKSPAGIPVYPLATSYLELEVIRSVDVGIHRLFLYRISGEHRVGEGKTLAHLHAWYVQWRINHGMSTEYFLR